MLRIFSVFLLLVFFPGPARALDLSAAAGAGNMVFDPESEDPLGADKRAFEERHLPWAYVELSGEFSGPFDFSFRAEQDLLLGRRILGRGGLNLEYLRLEFGPFIGAFNTEEQPINPGILGGLVLQYPGIIFGSLKVFSTLGSTLRQPGEYIQSGGEAGFGFYVPHAICFLSVNAKTFTRRMSDELLVKDSLIRYQLSADMFSKIVPYTVRVDLGYQALTRSYSGESAGGSTETDELRSVFAGFEGTWRIRVPLKLILGLEMPLYSWAVQPLKNPDRYSVLYRAHAGFIWTFGER
ncbi:MAG: hypothetical protein LBS57_12255 [Treponema sp.]|nr:hypothetical protein [Treponema sp.]